MADREKERAARNKNLMARMCVAPTKAQILAELDREICDAINSAVAVDLHALAGLLRMARIDMSPFQQRGEPVPTSPACSVEPATDPYPAGPLAACKNPASGDLPMELRRLTGGSRMH
jgi:hypothetical protein